MSVWIHRWLLVEISPSNPRSKGSQDAYTLLLAYMSTGVGIPKLPIPSIGVLPGVYAQWRWVFSWHGIANIYFIIFSANPKLQLLSFSRPWPLMFLLHLWQRHAVDFYISDFQSGLRALVKTGYGARVTPYVYESVIIDINPDNKDMSPEFLRWLRERNLSSDDRTMRLKEGYSFSPCLVCSWNAWL